MSTIRTIGETSARIATVRAGNQVLSLLIAVILGLQAMVEKSRSRRALSALSDEQLKDIGLSRSSAFREASRPFWD